MPRSKTKSKDLAAHEATPLEAKPKRRRSAAKETSEPTPVAEVLERSPAVAAILEAKAEPVAPELEQPAERVPASFAEAVKASRAAFGPMPEGFVNVASHPAAGIKFNRSRDNKVAAIQFAEDRLPSRPEKDILEDVGGEGQGFVYKTARRQWERYDGESPGANLTDAKRVADGLASEREGRGR